MLRRTTIIASLILLLPALLQAYTIVLKDGRRIEAQARYVVEGEQASFTDMEGNSRTLPLAEIDLAATRRANRPKVWSNDEIEQLTGAAVSSVGRVAPPPTAEGAAPAEGEPGTEGGEPLPPKEETREYWQERLQKVRDELAQVDQQLQQLRSNQGQAASNSVDILGGNPGVQVEDTVRQLESRRAQLQQQISDIQEEARRLGVPPGWVR